VINKAVIKTFCTSKKGPVPFPDPSRNVTDQAPSSREYVSLMKPGVFPDIPFPSPDSHRIIFYQLMFQFTSSQAGVIQT